MTDRKYMLCAIVATLGLLIAFSSTIYAQPGPEATLVNSELLEPAIASFDAGAVAPAELATELVLEPGQAAKNALGTAGEVIDDVGSGDWRHAVAGFLTLFMLGLNWARKETDWFSGDRAGAGLVLGVGLLGALTTALYGSAPISLGFFAGALGVVAESAGFYVIVKKLLFPSDKSQK